MIARISATSEPIQSMNLRSDSNQLRSDLAGLLAASGRMQDGLVERLAELTDVIEERDLLHTLIDQVPDQLFIKDKSLRFLVVNNAVVADKTFLDGTPMSTSALIGKSDFDLFPREIAQKFADAELEIMRVGVPVTIDMRENIDGHGWSRWVSMTKVPIRNDKSEIIGLLGVGRDVTSRKQAEERVQFLAHHDFLTSLPNRALFLERLSQSVADAAQSNSRLAVVFCDLDRFKQVNDSLGHPAGDNLLTVMADRMVTCLRRTDTVARLGGDEFVFLLNEIGDSPHHIIRIVADIRHHLAQPAQIQGYSLSVTTSMGVAIFPDGGRTAESLIVAADAAMYRAKEYGRNNVQYHT